MTQLIKTQNQNSLPGPAMMQSPEPPENPHMPMRRLTEGVFRARGLLILFGLVGGTIGAGMGIVKPNEYRSKATFLFRHGSEQVPIKTSEDLPRGWGQSSGVYENAPHLLVAPALARRTVERLSVQKVFQPFQPKSNDDSWLTEKIRSLQSSIHERDPKNYSVQDAAEFFLGKLVITNFRRAAMMQVSYTANEPRLAQEVLEAYCDEAIKFHIEAYGNETEIKLVESRHKAAKAAFEAAQKQHGELLQKSGLTNFEIEFAALQTEARQAERDYRAMIEQTIPSLELQIGQGEKRLATLTPRIERTVQVPVPNQMIGQLNARILEAEDALLAARNKYAREDHPVVKKARRQLEDFQGRLRDEQAKPPKLVDRKESVLNEKYSRLESETEKARIGLLLAKQRLLPAKARAESAKKRFDSVAKLAQPYRQAAADLERARNELRMAGAQLSQAHTKKELAENQLSSLKLVGHPTFEPSRTGPKRSQMALLGLIAGLGLAFMFVAVRTLTDSTIRSPEELEKMLGLRVLATVPDLRGKHVRRHENRILSGC